MNSKIKGYVAGIVSAISYGLNPLGALFMYDDGMRPPSVLFYRFSLAATILALVMLVERKSFLLTKKESLILLSLGILFSASSITYYTSFQYMDAGIACTILFFYPVMVAVIMALFFKEKLSASTVIAIVLSLIGILMLYQGDGNTKISSLGMALVILSSLTYAVYIIVVNKSSIRMSSIKLTMYVLIVCAIMIGSYAYLSGQPIQTIPTTRSWICAIGLALIPTVISLVTLTIAVNNVGSTAAAIMGALEPVTAVIIGVLVFGEVITPRLATGMVLIMGAVLLIILGKKLSPKIILASVSRKGKKLVKHWRWK